MKKFFTPTLPLKYCKSIMLIILTILISGNINAQCVTSMATYAEPAYTCPSATNTSSTLNSTSGGKQTYTLNNTNGVDYQISIGANTNGCNGAYTIASVSGPTFTAGSPVSFTGTGTAAVINILNGGTCTWCSGNTSAALTYTHIAYTNATSTAAICSNGTKTLSITPTPLAAGTWTVAAGSGTFSGLTAGGGTFTPTSTGTVTLNWTKGGCVYPVTFTVNPVPVISLTSGSSTPAAFCQNTALPTNIVYTLSGGATGASVSGLPTGMSGTLSGTTYTISGTPSVSGTFNYTVTTSGGSCSTVTATGTITVNPIQAISLTSGSATPAAFCQNTALPTNTVYTLSGGATGASVSGLPSGMSGTLSGLTYTISGTPTVSGTFPYTVTTSGTCASTTATGTITVSPIQAISLTSGSANPAAFCRNTALPTNIVYTLSGGATGASVSGLPAGMSGTLSGLTYTISGTPTASGTFPYTVTTSGTCASTTATGTITVSPVQAIALTSGSATPAAFCQNTALPTNIVYTLSGGATGASVSGLPSGMSGALSGLTYTISGTPSVSGTFPFTITTSGTCASTTATGTITVNPIQSISLTSGSSSQSICAGVPLTSNIVYTIGGGATGATTSGLPAGVTGSLSGTTYTISGTNTVVSGTFPFTVTTSGTCAVATATGSIQVNPNQTITLTSGSATPAAFCQNTALPTNIVYTLGGGATTISSVTGLPTGITGTLSGTTYTISGTPTVSGTFNYNVFTGGTCSGTFTSGTIVVNPVQTISLTSGSATPASFCVNTALPTNIVYTIGGGATGATTSGLPSGMSGTLSGTTYTISGTPSVSGTFPYTVTTSGTCATSTATGTITVAPAQTITLTSGSATPAAFCQNTALGTNIVYTLGGGATGASVSGLPSGMSGVLSGTTYTISGTPSVSGTFNYTVTTSGTCASTTATGTIVVNPIQTITLTSGSSTPAAFCRNSPLPTNIVYTIGGGATGASVSGLPAGMSGSLSGSTFTISGTPTVSGTFNYTVTTSGTCATATATGTITVAAQPTPTITPTGVTCVGSNATYTTQSGQSSYVWTVSGTSGVDYTVVSGGTGTDNNVVVTWLNAGAHSVSVNYSNAAGCSASAATSSSVTVASPPGSASITDNIDPCNGGHTAYVTISGGTSPYNFTLTPTPGTATAYTNQTSPFEVNAAGATSYLLSGVTDNNGCPAGSITGSNPVTYASRALTSGNSQACTVAANSTQIFFDASAHLMAKVTAGSTALGGTTVVASIDGSVQNFGAVDPQSYLQRHFQITPATSAPATVCLYISDAEVSALSSASASDNHSSPSFYQTFSTSLANANITKYHGGTEAPGDPSATRTVITSITATHNPTVNGATYSSAWELCFNVTSFSGFYIHAANTNSTPLPVTLVNFSAKAIDNKYIELNWLTASELDNSGFQVERSTNGVSFDAIGWVEGHGSTSAANSYKYSDITAMPGVVYYYRLKQVDFDGKHAYSELSSASLTGSKGFSLESLVPNPANNQVSIGVISNVDASATITMTDMLGRVVFHNEWPMSVGYNINQFDLSTMPVGTYLVTIFSGDIKTTKKLVITR